jgi:hypothetical protein
VPAALAAIVALAGGCGDEGGPAVRLILETTVAVPSAVDEVTVEATASRTPDGETCEAARRTFPLGSAADLPLRVLWEFGPEYRAWAAFRITWLRSGRVVAVRTELRAAPEDGVTEVRVALEPECLTRTCGVGEQCVAGACAGLPEPDPFALSLVVPGTFCADER